MKTRAQRARGLGLNLEIDRGLPSELRTLVLSDLVLLGDLRMQGGDHFQNIFGGTRSANVLGYFDERIHYVLPNLSDDTLQGRFSAVGVGSAREMASNISLPAWIHVLGHPDLNGYFRINGHDISVQGTRTGLMRFGEGYADYPDVARLGVLVHEARHSDCPEGLPNAFFQSGDLSRLRQCGHNHTRCPAGHTFGGLPACDSEPWGAYSVSMVYFSTLARSCANCSEQDRQVAEAQALDSSSRLMLDREAMLGGSYGPPNMSAIPQITYDNP
jgi:hypothetical protein